MSTKKPCDKALKYLKSVKYCKKCKVEYIKVHECVESWKSFSADGKTHIHYT